MSRFILHLLAIAAGFLYRPFLPCQYCQARPGPVRNVPASSLPIWTNETNYCTAKNLFVLLVQPRPNQFSSSVFALWGLWFPQGTVFASWSKSPTPWCTFVCFGGPRTLLICLSEITVWSNDLSLSPTIKYVEASWIFGWDSKKQNAACVLQRLLAARVSGARLSS